MVPHGPRAMRSSQINGSSVACPESNLRVWWTFHQVTPVVVYVLFHIPRSPGFVGHITTRRGNHQQSSHLVLYRFVT